MYNIAAKGVGDSNDVGGNSKCYAFFVQQGARLVASLSVEDAELLLTS